MVLKVTLCSTPASIALAVSALSIHSVILVECIGKDLGKPGCVLSIISLCDSLAGQVFLIDVLAFPSSPNHCISQSSTTPPSIPCPHPALAPLLALLSLPHITKVFFDGRPDVLELLLAYGLVLANVLDLQLVEVAARVHKCKPGRPDPDLIKHSFKSISAEVEDNPSAYAGIHTLRGLEHVVGLYNLLPKDSDATGRELKDSAVVAMRKSCGSAMWLARPLPELLLTYAAHRLSLIAAVYAHFTGRKWVCEHMRTLRAQSSVYVGLLASREESERLNKLRIRLLLPLGIIDRDGGDEVDKSAPRYVCECCRRDLTLDCYAMRLQSTDTSESVEGQGVGDVTQADARERLSYCRLCNAIAQRNKRALGEWVVF
ncbi:uncharacterized protein TRAVEDRAFT_52850 [Trametes versicolor FP-101664 SS1]|uniref:uncharacterized protein n=1 Tax=Trametes versicolor (strain FP-101664) TaxID=717944 RepID=UPI0004621A9C|nr:uncharacterized protein TRAVEDRAFT_52850 [Trametes versicolor FP-101664 SS1]EIW53730.1 hypothetical protein TRAVEDRAFT_52850 [Trametes versicolor FP-101664 SS1]